MEFRLPPVGTAPTSGSLPGRPDTSQAKAPAPSATPSPSDTQSRMRSPSMSDTQTRLRTPPASLPSDTQSHAGAPPSVSDTQSRPRMPSPHRVVLPHIEHDPNARPPLRASSESKSSPSDPVSVPAPRPVSRPVASVSAASAPTPALDPIVTDLFIRPAMALIPGGSFLRGSKQAEDEQPVHSCTVDSFYLALHPVTNEEYRKFVLATGYQPPRSAIEQYAIWDGDDFPPDLARRPVVHLSWNDASAYCEWLARVTGQPFRLPSEAEWERAARGGLEGKTYPWGDDDPAEHAVFDMLWTGPSVIPPVGTKPPNGYGLYDMAGLVWEWCRDYYHRRYYDLPEATEPNPVNLAPSLQRIQRGGAWLTGPLTLRCSYRGKHRPDAATSGFGFRVARDV